MKKVLVSAVVFFAILFIATGVCAYTQQDLYNYLTKAHEINGQTYQLTEADKVKVERFLADNLVTDEQAAQIKAKADVAINYLEQQDVKDVTKLNKTEKEKLLSLANDAADVVGVSLTYNAGDKTVSVFKDGKLIESVSTNSNKLVQTGSSNYEYLVPVVALIAIATVVSMKRKANAK